MITTPAPAPVPATLAVRSVLVGLQIGALGLAILELSSGVLGGSIGVLLVYCIVVAVEAHWTHWLLTERLPQSFDRHWFRGVELLLLGGVGLLLDGLLSGQASDFRSLTSLGLRSVFVLLLIALTWLLSTATASDFARLGELPERDPNYVPPLESLTRRYFIGGALLLMVIGLTLVDPRLLLRTTRSPVSGPIFPALVYFVLGLVLLALAQQTILARRWNDEAVVVDGQLGPRWARLSLLFMVGAALLALILPTAYGLGLLDLLALVVQGLLILATLLGIGVVGPLAWLLSLLTGDPHTPTPSAPAAPPPTPPPPPAADSAFPFLELLRWGLLGGIVCVVVVWLLRGWLANREQLAGGLGRWRLLTLLRAFWQRLLQQLRGVAATIAERLPRRNHAATGPQTGRRTASRRGRGKTPRDAIVRYYLALTDRAAAQGLGRQPDQTATEYSASLTSQLPDNTADLANLTTAFTEARYSDHDMTTAESEQAKGAWESLRSALRNRQHNQESGS